MNPKVNAYLQAATRWREEMSELRKIALNCDCGLTEELKWGKPCYTFEGHNVVVVIPFKAHCALLFCKGALLQDEKGFLVQPTENTQAARQFRFTGVQEIEQLSPVVQNYLREAVEVEKAGLEVAYKKPGDFAVPAEFRARCVELPALQTAFETLTPGRQRGYLLHFAAAKQAKTRASRVAKWLPQILNGKGLNDE